MVHQSDQPPRFTLRHPFGSPAVGNASWNFQSQFASPPRAGRIRDNGAYVSQIDGWTVFRMGSLCVCSTVFTAGKNAYIGEAWGSVYSTSDTFKAPDYPVAFKSPPASVFDYVGADDDSAYAAFAYRDVTSATAKTAGEVWLMRPSHGATIGRPKFAVLAMGLV